MNADEGADKTQCDRLSDDVLAEIQREVDRGNCPSLLLGPICSLLALVRTLQSEVDVLSRKRDADRDFDIESDTTLF